MKKNPASQSGVLNLRTITACAFFCVASLLTYFSLGAPTPSGPKEAEIKTDSFGKIYVTPIQGVHGGVAATAGLVAPGAVLAATPSVGWRLLQSGTPETRNGATMVYYPALGANVMFGGHTGIGWPFVDSANTWTFDGQAWSRVLTAHSPMGRHGASMAYDAAHQMVLLFGGVGNDTNSPTNDKYLNDTWSFDGVDWTQLTPTNSPSPRAGASMVFDAARNQILLYGGSPDTNSPPADNDTWTWDGTNWTQQQPPASPQTLNRLSGPGRWDASMVYDPDAQMVVLFGGAQLGYPGLNDTWEWNGTTWTPFPSAIPPPGRLGAVMDYDAASKSLVLFGGATTTVSPQSYLNDTWTWDTTNGWKQLSPPNSPSPRGANPSGTRGSMSGAYDPKTSRLYFSHGHLGAESDQGIDTDETWSWDGTTWTQIVFNIPPGRVESALGYDAATDQYVLFGGLSLADRFSSQVGSNDTWIWKGGSWRQARPANSPSARYLCQLAYDPGSGRLVLFGGSSGGTSCLSDTWTWDGTNWRFEAVTTPPPVNQGAMASDPTTGNIVMFGGYDCSTQSISNGTWTYTNGQWTKLTPSVSPAARFSAAVAYDRLGYLVLFGGGNFSIYMGDTWIWDGTIWSPQLTSTFPSQREFASMALDDVTSGHPVLYGGIGPPPPAPSATLNDTWTWMESAGWTQQTPILSPDPRQNPAMAPAGSGSPALLWGGSFRNDLWGFGPPPPVQLSGVVSRKVHGSAGTFDVNLPLSGTRGVECRNVGALPGGATGDYQLVFSFANPLTSVGGASVTSGTASVSSSAIGTDPHQYIVNLTGVSNAQYVTVTLTNVNDSLGNSSSSVLGPSMGVLIGDVNSTGLVDGNDVSAVQGQARQTANSTNFRLDVNTTGLIDGNDVSLVQSKTRTSLPSPP